MDGVIFDVDGTLWDTTDLVAEAWNKGAKDLEIEREPITGDRLKREFGKPMDIIVANLFPKEAPSVQEEILRVCCLHEHCILEENQKSVLFPGVRETFQTLAQSCKVCIVSNCQVGYIELFLRKNGLEKYVTDYESFGNTHLTKGENIRLVMERNDLRDVVYVGDTQGDFDACRYAGIPFVYAAYGFGQVTEPDYRIGGLRELFTSQILGFNNCYREENAL